jgi:hypothetical protein
VRCEAPTGPLRVEDLTTFTHFPPSTDPPSISAGSCLGFAADNASVAARDLTIPFMPATVPAHMVFKTAFATAGKAQAPLCNLATTTIDLPAGSS